MKKAYLVLALAAAGFVGFGFMKSNSAEIPEKVVSSNRVGIEIGDEAPELKFPNPEGKELSLKSLRGNYVLVDFWASWCGPCRYENPNVVATYEKFKTAKFGKGTFKIFSVSLDKNPEAWKKAIEKDRLTWPDHVSDLQGWQSQAAALYQVNSIPTNFLLDGNGIIVAKNLRGGDLETAIAKYAKGKK